MKNVKTAIVLCLFLIFWTGSALADLDVPQGNQDIPDSDPAIDPVEDNPDDVGEVDDDTGEVDDDTGEVDDGTDEVDDGTDEVDDGTDEVDDDVTDDLLPDDDADDGDDIISEVGPRHVLYNLKIAFENIHQSFTYDPDVRLGLQVSAARHRLKEAKYAMENGDDEAAEIALKKYKKKMDDVDKTLNNDDIGEDALTETTDSLQVQQATIENMVKKKRSQGKNTDSLTEALASSEVTEEESNRKIIERRNKKSVGINSDEPMVNMTKGKPEKGGKGRK